MSCSVKNCFHSKRFKPKDITFHRFPNKDGILNEWRTVLELGSNWKWTQNKYVCSKHFKVSDFIAGKERINLKRDAVPSLHLSPPVNTSSSLASTSQDLDDSQQSQQKSFSSFSSEISEKTAQNKSRAKLKCPLRSSFGPGSSSDSSYFFVYDSTTKRRAKFVKIIHNYALSPSKVKQRYEALRQAQTKTRKQLYAARKTIENLKRKITTLNTVVQDLQKNQLRSDGAIGDLQKHYENIPHVLMSRFIKNTKNQATTRENYPEQLRNY